MTRRAPAGLAALAALWLAPAGTAGAHDLWLVPPDAAAPKKEATVVASVGMDFPASEHAADPAAFARRVAVRPDGTEAPLEAAGKDEAAKTGSLRFVPDRPGWWAVAVETAPKSITLEAAEFNEYLVTDGLAHVWRMRAREKTLGEAGRERYSKSPKALLKVGTGGGGDPTRPVGLPLEIVPLADPSKLKAGATLRVRVLFRGAPLSGAWIGWDLPGDGEDVSGTARTDEKGEAVVPITRLGLMTLRLTHMTRPKTAEYEWESFWTTLTFRAGK